MKLENNFLPVLSRLPKLSHVICFGEEKIFSQTVLSIEHFDKILGSANIRDSLQNRSISSDLAALIYTSGSTGSPKGVMHTHQSMLFALNSLVEYLRLSDEHRVLNVLPLSFDYGLYQLLMVVHLGATLILEKSFTFPAPIFKSIQEKKLPYFPAFQPYFPCCSLLMNAAHSVFRQLLASRILPPRYLLISFPP